MKDRLGLDVIKVYPTWITHTSAGGGVTNLYLHPDNLFISKEVDFNLAQFSNFLFSFQKCRLNYAK